MINKQKRKEIEEVIITTMKLMDPSELNSNHYIELFSKMDDKEFDDYIKRHLPTSNNVLDDTSDYFRMTVVPNKNDLDISNIEKAANYLGVPLFERVSEPFINMNKDEIYQTQDKVPVGYLFIKRPEQMASKKNGMSINIDQRNPLTNQVVNKSKNGRVTDIENLALTTKNCPNIRKEFLSARSDDMKAKNEILKQIKNDGYCSMEKVKTRPQDKTALNTLDVYFTACGIKTNLITNNLMLRRTEENLSNIDKTPESIGDKYKK